MFASCQVAAQALQTSAANCKSEDLVQELLETSHMRVHTKLINTYFNLDEYLENGVTSIPTSTPIQTIDLNSVTT